MKKLITIALAACLVLGLALPAMADVDVKISGEFRTDGVYNDNTALSNGTKVADAYYKGRIRIKPVIMVNDNISITTQFDVLERTWGTSDESAPGTTGSDDNIDVDYGYATLKTPVGGFLVGRMPGSSWGTSFLDNKQPKDRIVYVLPMDKLILAAVIEKTTEQDAVSIGTVPNQSDADLDEYYLTLTYKAENFTAGLLYGFYNYKRLPDMFQAVYGPMGAAVLPAEPTADNWAEGTAHILSPYVKGKFGPISIEAEYSMGIGKAKYDGPYWHLNPGFTPNAGNKDSKDIDVSAYMVDLNYEMGPFSIGGGYAFSRGDANFNDDKINSHGYFKAGHDWEKTLILHSNEIGVHGALGGTAGGLPLGVPVGGNNLATWYGYKVFFFQADYDLTENLTFGAVYANSEADKTPMATWKEEHGSEIDVKITWKFLDNVTWTNTAGFLTVGDFYKAGAAADIGDTYALFSRIAIKF
ncbi:MAG: porin [Desulfobacterales bacterium]|nr:porin [Desulfobacterales bacterium]